MVCLTSVLRSVFLIFPLVCLFALNFDSHENEIEILTFSLNRSLNFLNRYYRDMNLDATLGIVLAEAQLLDSGSSRYAKNERTAGVLKNLVDKCSVWKTIAALLPRDSGKTVLFVRFLLDSNFWRTNVRFVDGRLENLGVYEWDAGDLSRSRSANFGDLFSDDCLMEIFEQRSRNLLARECYASRRCETFMFGERVDVGYVLTHRLLYLQIVEKLGCIVEKSIVADLKKTYCSLILKEARTNAILGFPQRDLFLEQVLLCGMEGFTEFFVREWRSAVVNWQTNEGCYKNRGDNANSTLSTRSSNSIAFGCYDHTTVQKNVNISIRYIYCSF